jgi:hypothetical protein
MILACHYPPRDKGMISERPDSRIAQRDKEVLINFDLAMLRTPN